MDDHKGTYAKLHAVVLVVLKLDLGALRLFAGEHLNKGVTLLGVHDTGLDPPMASKNIAKLTLGTSEIYISDNG